MEDIIKRQRATVEEHIRTKNAGDWPAVYNTFVQSEVAYYDVIPYGTKFEGIEGVKDFYQTLAAAIPDLHIAGLTEYDVPGCSIREVTLTGTHRGEYFGVPASSNPIRVDLAAFYLFDVEDTTGKLLGERVYFDNATLLRQMRGEEKAYS